MMQDFHAFVHDVTHIVIKKYIVKMVAGILIIDVRYKGGYI
jgi:hypothetical protein